MGLMGLLAFLVILIAAGGMGARLLRTATRRRGRELVCAKCDYEVQGRDRLVHPCPECGADLLQPGATAYGAKSRSLGKLALGAVVIGSLLLSVLSFTQLARLGINWYQFRSTAAVIAAANRGEWEADQELASRLATSKLQESDLRAVVQAAMQRGSGAGGYSNALTRFVQGVIQDNRQSEQRDHVLDLAMSEIEQNRSLPYGTFGYALGEAYVADSLPETIRRRLGDVILSRLSDPAASELEGATYTVARAMMQTETDRASAQRLVEVSVNPTLSIDEGTPLIAGNTVFVNVDLGYRYGNRGSGYVPFDNFVSMSFEPIGECESWPFAGDLVRSVVRRQFTLREWTGQGFWVTLPDEPGNHTLKLKVDARVHGARAINSSGSIVWSYPDPSRRDQPPFAALIREITLPIEVRAATEMPAEPVPFAEGWGFASGWGFGSNSGPFVWADPESGWVHVNLNLYRNRTNIAVDISIVQNDVEHPIGWVMARTSDRFRPSFRGGGSVSAQVQGLEPGLARLVLRPSWGILRKPVDFNEWWAEEVVIPVEVFVPDAAIWENAYSDSDER